MNTLAPERLFAGRKYIFLKRAKRANEDSRMEDSFDCTKWRPTSVVRRRMYRFFRKKRKLFNHGSRKKWKMRKRNRRQRKRRSLKCLWVGQTLVKASWGKFWPCTCIAVPNRRCDSRPQARRSHGIEVDEDVPLSTLVGPDNETIDYDREPDYVSTNDDFVRLNLRMNSVLQRMANSFYSEEMIDRLVAPSVVWRNRVIYQHNFPPIIPLNGSSLSRNIGEKREELYSIGRQSSGCWELKARSDLIELIPQRTSLKWRKQDVCSLFVWTRLCSDWSCSASVSVARNQFPANRIRM